MLVDGVGSAALADSLVPGLQSAGRPALRVSAGDFQRPAGERFEWGREDEESFRARWLDAEALEREVLSRADAYLPALWDAEHDRSARRSLVPLPDRAVLLVDGILLLGRGLTAELTVHLSLSPGALRRRGVPDWQLPAFATYATTVRPEQACDVLVRAEDPRRPAVVLPRGAWTHGGVAPDDQDGPSVVTVPPRTPHVAAGASVRSLEGGEPCPAR